MDRMLFELDQIEKCRTAGHENRTWWVLGHGELCAPCAGIVEEATGEPAGRTGPCSDPDMIQTEFLSD